MELRKFLGKYLHAIILKDIEGGGDIMLIFTWTGLGLLAVIVPSVILIICGFLSDVIGSMYFGYIFSIGLFLSAIICLFLGIYLNRKKAVSRDMVTGELIYEKNMNRLFSIPIQYFSIIYLLLAIVCFFSKVVK